MKRIGLILGVSFFIFGFDLSQSSQKKMDKTLAKLWPEKTIIKKLIKVEPSVQKTLSFRIEENSFYSISMDTKSINYMLLSKGKGKMDVFDYMVVFNSDLSILKVKVLVYREDYGGEIGSNRWLKQFIGKSDPETMKFGHDIQNISGATISARSLTEDVKKVTRQMVELKHKGVI